MDTQKPLQEQGLQASKIDKNIFPKDILHNPDRFSQDSREKTLKQLNTAISQQRLTKNIETPYLLQLQGVWL